MINRLLDSTYSKNIKRISEMAENYDEWLAIAQDHDQESGQEEWKNHEESNLYDYEQIRIRLDKLRAFRKKKDDHGLLFTLNEGIHGNMGGIGNPKLYVQALSGTKHLITDYVDEVADSIAHIANVSHDKISFEDKIDFFRRASHCFGRTALMLSGGGQLGHFHMGVLKAMIETNQLPNVISGSSAGSIFTALIGTYSLDDLKQYFEPDNLMVEVEREQGLLARIIKKRKAVGVEHLKDALERNLPNLTFQEAFEKTGRYINISVAPHESYQKSRLLNTIASPNVLIRSAVMASCAIPGIFPPVTLMAKDNEGNEVPYLPTRKWVDGSMTNDLPAKRLSRLFGVNHFVVSMTNPVMLPFVSDTSHKNEWFNAARKFGTALLKESTQFNYSLSKPFFKYWPRLAVAANGINSIVQQSYHGDINIIADFSVIKPTHLLSSLTYEEIANLIKNGEKTTWPKIERLRVATKIARLLDGILLKFEQEEIDLAVDKV